MKLRSGTAVDVSNGGKIAEIFPVTRVMYVAEQLSFDCQRLLNFGSTEINCSSMLLKLPQEIKNEIYEMICGGALIHIEVNNRKIGHTVCTAKISETQAQENFDKEVPSSWYAEKNVDRHAACCPNPIKNSLNVLRVCRQIYHEAKYLPYLTNTFSFQHYSVLRRFFKILVHSHLKLNLAIRSVHVRVQIPHMPHNERQWNDALRFMGNVLPRLRCLYIDIEMPTCVCSIELIAKLKRQDKPAFMPALYMLPKLPLKAVVLLISDYDSAGFSSLQDIKSKYDRLWSRNRHILGN